MKVFDTSQYATFANVMLFTLQQFNICILQYLQEYSIKSLYFFLYYITEIIKK